MTLELRPLPVPLVGFMECCRHLQSVHGDTRVLQPIREFLCQNKSLTDLAYEMAVLDSVRTVITGHCFMVLEPL